MPDLRVNDFSGGETDRYRDGDPRYCQTMKNLLVSENRRAMSRPGFEPLSEFTTRPFLEQKIDFMWHHHYDNESYETFILSNGAIRARLTREGVPDSWRIVTSAENVPAAGGETFYPFMDQKSQPKYVRLNYSEFVVMASGDDYPYKFVKYSPSSEWFFMPLGLPTHRTDLDVGYNQLGVGNNWGYAFVLKHEYQTYSPGSGFITKIVRSEPKLQLLENVDDITFDLPDFKMGINGTSNYSDNEGWPNGSIGDDQPFDFGNIVWEIYRTTNNGTIFYKLGEGGIDGGSFYDSAILNPDADLVDGEILYTTGGVLPNQMTTDRVDFATFANDILWLASDSRVWQSKVGIYDAHNGSFNFTVREGETITGMSTFDIYPIIFTNAGVYRIEGVVDDLGNGIHRVRTISEREGALSEKSIVKADDRILYWSTDGVYETNGYTSRNVTKHYNDSYCAIKEIYGDISGTPYTAALLSTSCWEDKGRRAYWFYTNQDDTYNPNMLVLDMKYPHEEGYSIQTGETPYGVTSCVASDGNVFVVTDNGMVLVQNKDKTSDFDIRPDQSIYESAIVWDYVSCVLSFGSSLMRKWFTRILMHLTNKSDVTFSVLSDTDESNDWRLHNHIRERGFTRGLYFIKRWFPRGKLRGTYKTIQVTNGVKQLLFKSDDNNVTCQNIGTSLFGLFPGGIWSGYEIAFDEDDYTARYEIRSTTTGPTAGMNIATAPPTDESGRRWQIYGIPRDEQIEMNGYTIDFRGTGEGHTQDGVTETSNV